jgi:hypothetical protein
MPWRAVSFFSLQGTSFDEHSFDNCLKLSNPFGGFKTLKGCGKKKHFLENYYCLSGLNGYYNRSLDLKTIFIK